MSAKCQAGDITLGGRICYRVAAGYRRGAMKLPRRTFLHLAAGVAALPAASRIARAQAYPSRPVRVIVPFAPGGQTDVVARLIAQQLSDRLGKQFYIENAAGAGGNIGAGRAAQAPPDGYTILFIDAIGFTANPSFGPQHKRTRAWRHVSNFLTCLTSEERLGSGVECRLVFLMGIDRRSGVALVSVPDA